MFCSNCGKENPDNAKFCASCGNALDAAVPQYTPPPPQPQYAPPPQPIVQSPPQYAAPPAQQTVINMTPPATEMRTSGLAITALVLGIIGFSIFAIIFGGVALGQIRKNPNLTGRGMAIAGLVLGTFVFLVE